MNSIKSSPLPSEAKYLKVGIIDIHGHLRGITLRSYEANAAFSRGVGFDGSSIPGFVEIHRSDMVAKPNSSALISLPWEDNCTWLALSYVFYPDGKPFEGDPRGLLKSYLEKLREAYGVVVNVGCEPEFFFVRKASTPVPMDTGRYCDLPPFDEGELLKREIIEILESIGFKFDKSHHEVAIGQHEVDFSHSDGLRTADNLVIFKSAVKAIAKKHGLIATFMPKPFWGVNGSGCHVHLSLTDVKTGRNLFAEKGEGLSETAKYFIGGLLEHARGMSLVVAPLVNSYKRLLPGYEAPVYVAWGYANRSTLVRVPVYYLGYEKAMRVEYRHPDPSMNPYLGILAVIAAGMDGIENKIEPGEPYQGNIYHASEEELERRGIKVLPGSLEEAIEAFKKDKVIWRALGDHVANKLVELKTKEWQYYIESEGSWAETRTKITQWEYEHYLEFA